MAGSGMGRQVKSEGKRSKREGGVCVRDSGLASVLDLVSRI